MKEVLNQLDYADDPAGLELERELRRTGTQNEPVPEKCPECGKELQEGSGYVGEAILYCPDHGIKWADNAEAVARVF